MLAYSTPPVPPPADVIVEKTELDPFAPEPPLVA